MSNPNSPQNSSSSIHDSEIADSTREQNIIDAINSVELPISSCAEGSSQCVRRSPTTAVVSQSDAMLVEVRELLELTLQMESSIPVVAPWVFDDVLRFNFRTRRNRRSDSESAIVLHKLLISHPESAIPNIEHVVPLSVEEPSDPLIVTEGGKVIIEELTTSRKRKSSYDGGRKKKKKRS
ncbi:hypothetical protein ZOSMA_123G00130 [Zostera marina]|uniref:Uncharacterized protein n=1 Tax=Zostera marina TaxID=29655 RepID=A0A0K9Q2K8_ZOSMR|nr:hypothetical protein ZOSMA_123G00130 [Zostera marina]